MVVQGLATLCRPEGQEQEAKAEISQIGPLKSTKERVRPSSHRSVELRFDVFYQQIVYARWGAG
jgi:hypothetical protein